MASASAPRASRCIRCAGGARSIGLWANLAAIAEIYRLYRRERPLLVHHVALKAALLGGIAARLARVPAMVSMIAGAGYLASAGGLRARLVARALRLAWPVLLLRPRQPRHRAE